MKQEKLFVPFIVRMEKGKEIFMLMLGAGGGEKKFSLQERTAGLAVLVWPWK